MASSLYNAPDIVRVKRRKNDESVDILYLEHKSKRTKTDQEFLFQRMASPTLNSDTLTQNRTTEQRATQTAEDLGFVAVSASSLEDESKLEASFADVSMPIVPTESYVHVNEDRIRWMKNGVRSSHPTIRTTVPGEESTLHKQQLSLSSTKGIDQNGQALTTPADGPPQQRTMPVSIKDTILQKSGAVTRQFQLSVRIEEATPTSGIVIPQSRKRKTGPDDTAVFVAARAAPFLRAGKDKSIAERVHRGISATVVEDEHVWHSPNEPAQSPPSVPPSLSFKRSGTKALRPKTTNEESSPTTETPNTKTEIVDSTFLQLLNEVQLEESEKERRAQPLGAATTQKYLPRAPALRYKDRVNPPNSASMMSSTLTEQLQQALLLPTGMASPVYPTSAPLIPTRPAPKIGLLSDESDDEYVYDTYVRVRVDEMAQAAAKSASVGMVIIAESDEQAWDQYIVHQGEEFDDEFSEDDENAENYYAADYPDEELDSEDEMGMNAYRFRDNGSDDEEYDFERDAVANDSDFEAGRFTFPRATAGGNASGNVNYRRREIDPYQEPVEDDYVHDFDDAVDEDEMGGGINGDWGNSFSRWLGMPNVPGLRTGTSSMTASMHSQQSRRQRIFSTEDEKRDDGGKEGASGEESAGNRIRSTVSGGVFGLQVDEGDGCGEPSRRIIPAITPSTTGISGNTSVTNAVTSAVGGVLGSGRSMVTGFKMVSGGGSGVSNRNVQEKSSSGKGMVNMNRRINREGRYGSADSFGGRSGLADDEDYDCDGDRECDPDDIDSVLTAMGGRGGDGGGVYGRTGLVSQFSPDLRTRDWGVLDSRFN